VGAQCCVVMLCWIVGRHDDSRLGRARSSVSKHNLYTLGVKADLISTGIADLHPDISIHSSTSRWSNLFDLLHGHVFGLALVETKVSMSVETFLTSRERQVADYWMMSIHRDKLLVFVNILECARCEPVRFRNRNLDYGDPFLFAEMGHATHDRLMRDGTIDGRRYCDVLDGWAARHNFDRNQNRDGYILSAIVMPTAHAILCAHRYWHVWGFPFIPKHKRQRSSYAIGQALWQGMEMDGDIVGDENEVEPFGPSNLLDVADSLRQCLPMIPDGDQNQDLLKFHIRKLDTMRNNFLLSRALLSRRAFAMDNIINLVVVAGLMRDVTDLPDVLKMSLQVSIPEPNLRAYFMELLKTKGRLQV